MITMSLQKFKEVYIDLLVHEYGVPQEEVDDDEDVVNLNEHSIVPIAFTTLGDNAELEIQVYFNIRLNRLESVVTGINIEEVEYLQYEDIEHACEDIGRAEFEALTRLEKLDVDELIEKDKALEK